MLPSIGTLPTSETTLYAVPTWFVATVDHLTLINDSGVTVAVYLFLTIGGVKISMVPSALGLDAKDWLADDRVWKLSEGNVISGYASVDGVDFFIGGEEKSKHGHGNVQW